MTKDKRTRKHLLDVIANRDYALTCQAEALGRETKAGIVREVALNETVNKLERLRYDVGRLSRKLERAKQLNRRLVAALDMATSTTDGPSTGITFNQKNMEPYR